MWDTAAMSRLCRQCGHALHLGVIWGRGEIRLDTLLCDSAYVCHVPCHVICDWRGTPSKIPKQEKILQIICFFHRFHFAFLFFIWCRKTGRFDGWNHKCITKLQTLDKIFVVTSSFLLVMLFYNFQATAMQPHKDLAWQWFIRCDINKVMDIYLTLMCV